MAPDDARRLADATMRLACVQVPLYATLGTDAVNFILHEMEMVTVLSGRSEAELVGWRRGIGPGGDCTECFVSCRPAVSRVCRTLGYPARSC